MRMTRLDTHADSTQHVRVTQIRTFSTEGEVALTSDARAVLQRVGAALDAQQPVRVQNDGFVAVDNEFQTTLPKENRNERQGKGKRGPTAGSRQGPARRKRPPSRSRTAGAAPRISGDVLQANYKGQLAQLAEAYPTLKILDDDGGMWLLARSSLISGLAQQATFIVALPYKPGPGPRSWGFWTTGGHRWIGPRHTNFGDGSICAFAPDEGAWSEGGDLRTLFDLYSVWALRHLHLEVFGRWPGKQYALYGADPRLQAYYRRVENKDDELCGCGSETRRYAECCKQSDLKIDVVEVISFLLPRTIPGGFATRRAPLPLVDFIEGRSALPKIADVHPLIASR